ncbi:hypothetical protein BC940DRAFT_338240 [Gongronella butleri]|nr:hypothetical protein BC940DRAFT_338240 [Gongronella butleri]
MDLTDLDSDSSLEEIDLTVEVSSQNLSDSDSSSSLIDLTTLTWNRQAAFVDLDTTSVEKHGSYEQNRWVEVQKGLWENASDRPRQGATFMTMDACREAIQRHGQVINTSMVTAKSERSRGRLTMTCMHGGGYRNRRANKPTDEETAKRDCPCFYTFITPRGSNTLELKALSNTHNHRPAESISTYKQHRKYTKDEHKVIDSIIKTNQISDSAAAEAINKLFKDRCVLPRDVANMRRRFEGLHGNGNDDMRDFVQSIEENGTASVELAE